jgi:hypothetical protein
MGRPAVSVGGGNAEVIQTPFGPVTPEVYVLLSLVPTNVPLACTILLDVARVLIGDRPQYSLLALLWIADGLLFHTGYIALLPAPIPDFAGHILTCAVAIVYALYFSLAVRQGVVPILLLMGSIATYWFTEFQPALTESGDLDALAFDEAVKNHTKGLYVHISIFLLDMVLLMTVPADWPPSAPAKRKAHKSVDHPKPKEKGTPICVL